jgi:mercuric ion binding protein
MKKIKYIVIACIALTITSCGNKTDSTVVESKTEMVNGVTTSTFKVWGNCDMCKETIEGSLKVDGISQADWSPETKAMVVSYDTAKISLDQIQKYIASVGYDNIQYKGDDANYAELPECCQYNRK